jgi:hypothetical protein
VLRPHALALAASDTLYLADFALSDEGVLQERIQERDALGHWATLALQGPATGQIQGVIALAVDGAGNLYVAETGNQRVQKYTPEP